eukprot:Skav214075  [mRNA]  locus=scaffold1291:65467:65697:+ [translate_table: standard]
MADQGASGGASLLIKALGLEPPNSSLLRRFPNALSPPSPAAPEDRDPSREAGIALALTLVEQPVERRSDVSNSKQD